MIKKQVKKPVQKEPEMLVCCPYFDAEKKACVQNDCIRMLGLECKFSNRNNKK